MIHSQIMEIKEIICDKFEQYCYDENNEKIKEYLETYDGLANYNNGIYFEIIADKGNFELLKLFIKHGAQIDIDNNYVLYTCAYLAFYDCLDYLLKYGADIEKIKHSCGYSNALIFMQQNALTLYK